MDRLQTPPRPLSQTQPARGEPSAPGGMASSRGQAPTAASAEPARGASHRFAWGSGAEAGAQGRTLVKSREPLRLGHPRYASPVHGPEGA